MTSMLTLLRMVPTFDMEVFRDGGRDRYLMCVCSGVIEEELLAAGDSDLSLRRLRRRFLALRFSRRLLLRVGD
jgi:hypothetical protein